MAHAYLFLNEFDKAKEIYLKIKDLQYDGKYFNRIILDDFEKLKGNGIKHKDIVKIEKIMVDAMYNIIGNIYSNELEDDSYEGRKKYLLYFLKQVGDSFGDAKLLKENIENDEFTNEKLGELIGGLKKMLKSQKNGVIDGIIND